ncbi:MAG: ParB/RepB/Spo0J family partition protein [Candidatus Sungbacteria bacterium]|nr:ParB/RepB/Spo0J family partition protein [Candidatus Sungbacteria bacterium]
MVATVKAKRIEQALVDWEVCCLVKRTKVLLLEARGKTQLVSGGPLVTSQGLRSYLAAYDGEAFDTVRFLSDEIDEKLRSLPLELARFLTSGSAILHINALLHEELGTRWTRTVTNTSLTLPYEAFAVSLETPLVGNGHVMYDALLVSNSSASASEGVVTIRLLPAVLEEHTERHRQLRNDYGNFLRQRRSASHLKRFAGERPYRIAPHVIMHVGVDGRVEESGFDQDLCQSAWGLVAALDAYCAAPTHKETVRLLWRILEHDEIGGSKSVVRNAAICEVPLVLAPDSEEEIIDKRKDTGYILHEREFVESSIPGVSILRSARMAVSVETGQEVISIPVRLITPNPYQPRRRFDEGKLAELGASIKEHGLLQPVVVRFADKEKTRYELVAGERRLRACKLAELEAISAIVREDLSAEDARELVLIENLQREDLTLIEEARSLAGLVEQYGGSYSQVAERVGKSEAHVRTRTALLALPESIQDLIDNGHLNAAQGAALLEIAEEAEQVRMAKRAVQLRLTANGIRGGTQKKPRGSTAGGGSGAVTLARLQGGLTQTFDALEGYDYPNLRDVPKRMGLKQQLLMLQRKLAEVLQQFGEG